MEKKIYKDQTVEFILDTGYASLATATELKIYYKKPDRTKGSWVAVRDGTQLKYEVIVDQEGVWQFQAGATLEGGEKALGEVSQKHVYPNIK